MDFSFTDLIDLILRALRVVFPEDIPEVLLIVMAWGVLLLSALFVTYLFIWLITKIIKLVKNELIPLFYNEENKHRRDRRCLFAEHVEHEIRRLNNLEAWSDRRFTELEAEVEAEGNRVSWLPFISRYDALRREPSLSEALRRSKERLILLEGEPGSGKSVALRHVTLMMAQKAMRDRKLKTVIPIYINLKTLESKRNGTKQSIDQNLIRDFVLQTLNRANDRDIEAFLDEEFDCGLHEGTWLFLFDSFDEISEVLSSTEADIIIRRYAEAIDDFLRGMNRCRGIVASREYRGPRHLGWPRFRILSLSEKRQEELIRRADLRDISESKLIGELGTAPPGMRVMASNPMFLGLLCEYSQKRAEFPQNSYVVYEEYVQNRLKQDAERLRRRFNLEAAQVRDAAERLAFCISADPTIGLSPTRADLQAAATRQNLSLGDQFGNLLDALEFLKLARSETETLAGDSKPFTFAHRRFQEYFATSIVLREPHRAPPRQLLTNGQWRETAVVILQTQPIASLKTIIDEIVRILSQVSTDVPVVIDGPQPGLPTDNEQAGKNLLPQWYNWPPGIHHILGILQDGFSGRTEYLPGDIRKLAGNILADATHMGARLDWKWSLEVAGVAPQLQLLQMLRYAFDSRSQLLKDIAYQQVSRLNEMTEDIAKMITQTLVKMDAEGELRRQKHVTKTHLTRIDKAEKFISVMDLLLSIPLISLILHFVALLFSLVLLTIIPLFHQPDAVQLIVGIFVTLIIVDLIERTWHYLRYKHFHKRFFLRLIAASVIILCIPVWMSTNLLSLVNFAPILQFVVSFPKYYYIILILPPLIGLWSLAATAHAKRGRFVERIWWPLIPVVTVPLGMMMDLIAFMPELRTLFNTIKANTYGGLKEVVEFTHNFVEENWNVNHKFSSKPENNYR